MNYETLASTETMEKLVATFKDRNIEVILVADKAAALAKVKELIPAGASVMNGSSTTLHEIGFVDYLKGKEHGWNNLHDAVLVETDSTKQDALRQQTIFAEYFLGSVHAISETGELVAASASGSQLAPYVYTAKNLIWVVGAQKITATLSEAIARVRDHVYPLEDSRMKSVGQAGSVFAKMLVYEREPEWSGRKLQLVLVNEKLGF